MSPIKKVHVAQYDKSGNMVLRMTLTARKGLMAEDFKSARQQVENLILGEVQNSGRYSVEWVRDGFIEGYCVGLAR